MRLAVRRALGARADAVGVRVDEEETERAVVDAGGHEDTRRLLGIGDKRLEPRQPDAVRVAHRARRRDERVARRRLRERRGQDPLARRDVRQPRPLLRIAAELHERQRAQHERREDRDRRHRPPHLAHQEAHRQEAQITAAESLGQGGTEQAGARECAPELDVVCDAARGERLQPFVRRVVRKDRAGQVGRLLLVVSKAEIHRVQYR